MPNAAITKKKAARKRIVAKPLPVKFFKVGQRVQMTPDAIQQGFQGRAISTRGTVTAGHPRGWTVAVRRDGLKHATNYSVAFWEAVHA